MEWIMVEEMGAFDWRGFLEQWSKELLRDPGVVAGLPDDVIASGWLGYPSATEEQIVEVEDHLGVTFPPSYRAFLRVSNGWRRLTPFIDRLWSTEDIEWFSVRNQEWIDISNEDAVSVSDEEYFVYGEEQTPITMRDDYMRTALEISDVGDSAVYLLNPQVVTEDGEWEAWFLARGCPARRGTPHSER